jgi:hypothetical protein
MTEFQKYSAKLLALDFKSSSFYSMYPACQGENGSALAQGLKNPVVSFLSVPERCGRQNPCDPDRDHHDDVAQKTQPDDLPRLAVAIET